MNPQQIETLEVVNEVLKGLTISLLAANPAAIPRIAAGLRGAASRHDASPIAAQMLAEMARGVEHIAAVRPPAA